MQAHGRGDTPNVFMREASGARPWVFCARPPSAKWPSDPKEALGEQIRGRRERRFFGGARSPRPRWKAARKPRYGMAEESPETMREAVFSEGRTLCVRLARLDVNRGRSWLGTSWREASGLAGACEAEANGFIAGVQSPPLRGMAKRCEEGLAGEAPGIMWRAAFSEGRTLCVRMARACSSRGIT